MVGTRKTDSYTLMIKEINLGLVIVVVLRSVPDTTT